MALYSEKPSFMGVKLFNILPKEIKIEEESVAFKRELSKWLKVLAVNLRATGGSGCAASSSYMIYRGHYKDGDK
ncbi:hypothetical protein J6590_017441 [Homalodisca vitripennis]|nr:hypothetical protein J6590_017441 [Homalodisca vitripennis]